MLTLNDGRSVLYQWDTGRKLSVAVDCTQVHYSNKVFGRSIDVDVVDGVAIIPDILLQTDKELTAWAFVGTPENGYTKISKTFKVNRRNKPADYVFTPPEQTTLCELVERLQKIEENQDPDAIKNAVDEYLEQNPVGAPVKSVNGKTGEVKLTAKDVGAISQDDLQNATNKALEQAKESGEFDGEDGTSVTVSSISESTASGGTNVVNFSDGKKVNIKNGTDGKTPVKGVDYFTEAEVQEIAETAAGMVDVPEGGGSSGPAYVASEEPPENTKALWVDTSEPEEAVALGVTATETAEGVDLYCTDELGTTKVSLRHGNGSAVGASGTVLVAASDAPDIIKAAAQYVCVGGNDQYIINQAIAAVGKGEVRLSGGNYYLTSEIVLADDITLTGKNAILNVCDEISSTITQAYTGGDTVIHVANTSEFLVGQKVATDAGIASTYPCRIIDIDDDALTVTLDTPLHSDKGFDANSYRLIADFTVLPCEGLTNVVIDGLVLNCNGDSYQFYDTALGGNGIMFYHATRCTAQNCTVNKSMNHGILTTSSEQCRVINCTINNAKRLGFDTFTSTDSGGHLIQGCTAKGCNIGYQFHNALNTIMLGCHSISNSTGISVQEKPKKLILVDNIVQDCGYGIKCIAKSGEDISIASNHITGILADAIQIDASTNAHNFIVEGNYIGNIKGNAINIIGVDGFTVTGNTINNVNYANTDAEILKAAIRLSGTASNGMVSGNHITLVSDDTTGCPAGIAEMANLTGGNNVVVNNVIRGARIAATQKVGANSKFENNYEFA